MTNIKQSILWGLGISCLALSACSSGGGGSTSADGAAEALNSLQGDWLTGCASNGLGGFEIISLNFSGAQQTFTQETFTDAACTVASKALQSYTATVSVGAATTTSSGVAARKIDLTLNSNGSITLSIFQLDSSGPALRIGDEDSPKDAEGRDTDLNFDRPFSKGAGASTPSPTPSAATPSPTPSPTPSAATPSPTPTACEADSDSDFDCATELQFSGSQAFVNESLSTTDDVDMFQFNMNSASDITLQTEGSLDTLCELYDGNRTLLAVNDDADVANFNCSISRTAEAAGTYFIKVEGFDDSSQGDYALRVTTPDGQVEGQNCTDADQNGGFACAVNLGSIARFDSEQSRLTETLDSAANDISDYYTFELTGGDSAFGSNVRLGAFPEAGSSLKVRCQLLTENRVDITPNDANNDPSSCNIVRGRVSDGTYYLAVIAEEGSGTFRLNYSAD